MPPSSINVNTEILVCGGFDGTNSLATANKITLNNNQKY